MSLPDHPSGEWATASRAEPRIGHPRPARVGPHLVSPTGAAPYPVVAEPASEPAVLNGRGRSRLATFLLVAVLLLVAGWQAWRLERVDNRLAASSAQLATALDRQDQFADRADRLEKQLAGVFDPEAISQTVLPSVFRVRAGNFTGTAFSVGDKAKDGQANLLTNFHVVESVWQSGSRKVFLERGKDEMSATIVKVDKGKDLALLRANRKIAGLDTAPATVKPGQQVVVVGAPLGLEDTVTTGVVSAYRPGDADGPTIQFDAPINPGNSGGPVVNSKDEVIGLATAKARDAEGIGIAVPIKTACDAFDVC
ncbi:S1C family serine protease [Amorphoplanes digitatis]|uniref:Putative serine protease PepD n=1 Tax=Actinoplanes digitatis TaxID=1868 RepID=A0A7W7HTK2_9ACTN|nr:putative serine protease PepD [Actinoplanes digitatis]